MTLFNKASAHIYKVAFKARPVAWFLDMYSDGKTTNTHVLNAMTTHLYRDVLRNWPKKPLIKDEEFSDVLEHILLHKGSVEFHKGSELHHVIAMRRNIVQSVQEKILREKNPGALDALNEALDKL